MNYLEKQHKSIKQYCTYSRDIVSSSIVEILCLSFLYWVCNKYSNRSLLPSGKHSLIVNTWKSENSLIEREETHFNLLRISLFELFAAPWNVIILTFTIAHGTNRTQLPHTWSHPSLPHLLIQSVTTPSKSYYYLSHPCTFGLQS